MDIARFPQGECITYQQVKKCMSGRSGMATGARRGQGCRPRPVCRYRREAEGRGGPSGPPRPYGLPVWVPAGQGTSPGHGSFTSIWLVYQNHKLTTRLPNAQEGGVEGPHSRSAAPRLSFEFPATRPTPPGFPHRRGNQTLHTTPARTAHSEAVPARLSRPTGHAVAAASSRRKHA